MSIEDETRKALREKAIGQRIVRGRASVYGDPATSFAKVAKVWEGVLGVPVTAVHVALCMAGLKLVRAGETPDYSDNLDDIEGYVSIVREILGDELIHARSVEEYLSAQDARNEAI